MTILFVISPIADIRVPFPRTLPQKELFTEAVQLIICPIALVDVEVLENHSAFAMTQAGLGMRRTLVAGRERRRCLKWVFLEGCCCTTPSS